MLAASKTKGCEKIKDWTKGVCNHIYWCSTDTAESFKSLILAKWKSLMQHIANKHEDHPDHLFPKCAHGEIEKRKWIKVGTKAYDKLQGILMKKTVLNDIQQLSPDAQTSALKGFHSTLNQWHPKMLCFSWFGTYCRHILASLHFNENINRKSQTSKDGNAYVDVTYPKFKLGDEVVREVKVPPTYEYVTCIKEVLLTLSKADLTKIRNKYLAKVPAALNTQFADRKSKVDAVQDHEKRKQQVVELYPSAQEQATCKRKLEEAEAGRLAQPPAKWSLSKLSQVHTSTVPWSFDTNISM
ncbi:uncharacterized protein LOC114527724 [Dendronephthya gigantea]|uniref:uncharacterized protein LOC114527724 n=1 Tax=Dendronephthya gigantea TaxID=151771 RepID=UPI00106B415E|nr:uncharacterized protein LOC114527724 [Dendronephthya gigantea]